MKIALIGYGKMGRAIEQICNDRKHQVVATIDRDNCHQLDELVVQADVAIEFTQPESAFENIKTCMEKGIPLVVGTTGWYHRFDEVKQIVKEKSGALFHATNFSLGVNIFFEINRKLAQIMANQRDYRVSIKEIHHTQKLDAPSGTAISLAEQIIEKHPAYHSWKLQGPELVPPDTIPIVAERIHDVPGTHLVKYQNEIDNIVLIHEAHNRKGFALGAVMAAEFLLGKKGIFNMSDLLQKTLA